MAATLDSQQPMCIRPTISNIICCVVEHIWARELTKTVPFGKQYTQHTKTNARAYTFAKECMQLSVVGLVYIFFAVLFRSNKWIIFQMLEKNKFVQNWIRSGEVYYCKLYGIDKIQFHFTSIPSYILRSPFHFPFCVFYCWYCFFELWFWVQCVQ